MRNILIITSCLVILLSVSFYYLLFGKQPIWDINYKLTPSPPVNSYEKTRSQRELDNTKNIDLYNTAIRDQDVHLCDGIVVNETKNECRDMIRATTAKKTWHIEECETLTNSGIIQLCRDTIHTDTALNTLDTKHCDSISDWDRKSFCQESVDEVVLRWYITNHTVSRELCNSLGIKYQAKCIAEVREIDASELYRNAVMTGDPNLCTTIPSGDLRSTCLDTINLKTAITTQNSTLCDVLENPEKKLYCFTQVSKNSDITLYKSAISHGDIGTCSRVSNENLRNKCQDTIIITTVKSGKDISLCDSLTNTGMILACQQLGQ